MSNIRSNQKFQRIAFEEKGVKVYVYFSADISASQEVFNLVGSAIQNALSTGALTGVQTYRDGKLTISYLVPQIDLDNETFDIFDLHDLVRNKFKVTDLKNISDNDLNDVIEKIQTISIQKSASKVEVKVEKAFVPDDIISAEAFFKNEKVKNKIKEKNNLSWVEKIGKIFPSKDQATAPLVGSEGIKFQNLLRRNSTETSPSIQSNSRSHSPSSIDPDTQGISSSLGDLSAETNFLSTVNQAAILPPEEQTQRATPEKNYKKVSHEKKVRKKAKVRNIDLGGTPGSETKSPDQAASHSPSKKGVVLDDVDAANKLEKLNTVKNFLIGYFKIPIEGQNIQTMSLNQMMSKIAFNSSFSLLKLNIDLKKISREYELFETTADFSNRYYFSKPVYELEADVATPIEKAVYKYPHVQYLVDAFMEVLYDSIWGQFSQFANIFDKEGEKNQKVEKMLLASGGWISEAINNLKMSPTNNKLSDNPFVCLNYLKNQLSVILIEHNISKALIDINQKVSQFVSNLKFDADLKANIKNQFESKLGIVNFLEIKNNVMGVSNQYKEIEDDFSKISKIAEQVKEKLKSDSERQELERKIKDLKANFSGEKLEGTNLYVIYANFVESLSIDELTEEDKRKLNYLLRAFECGIDHVIEKNNLLDSKRREITSAFHAQSRAIQNLIDDKVGKYKLKNFDELIENATKKIESIGNKILQYIEDYPKKIFYLNQIENNFDIAVQEFSKKINAELSSNMEEEKKAKALLILQSIRSGLDQDKPDTQQVRKKISEYKEVSPNSQIDTYFNEVEIALNKKQRAIREQMSAVSYYENGKRALYQFSVEIKSLKNIKNEFDKEVNMALAGMQVSNQKKELKNISDQALNQIKNLDAELQEKISEIFKQRENLNEIDPDLLAISKNFDSLILGFFQQGSAYSTLRSNTEKGVSSAVTEKSIDLLRLRYIKEIKTQNETMSLALKFKEVLHTYLKMLSQKKISQSIEEDLLLNKIKKFIKNSENKESNSIWGELKNLNQEMEKDIRVNFSSSSAALRDSTAAIGSVSNKEDFSGNADGLLNSESSSFSNSSGAVFLNSPLNSPVGKSSSLSSDEGEINSDPTVSYSKNKNILDPDFKKVLDKSILDQIAFKNLSREFSKLKEINERYQFNLKLNEFNLFEKEDLEFNGIKFSQAITELSSDFNALNAAQIDQYKAVIEEIQSNFLSSDGFSSRFSQWENGIQNKKEEISKLYRLKVDEISKKITSYESSIKIIHDDLLKLKEADLHPRFYSLYRNGNSEFVRKEKEFTIFLSEEKKKVQDEDKISHFNLDLNLMSQQLDKKSAEFKAELEKSYQNTKRIFAWSFDFKDYLLRADSFKESLLNKMNKSYTVFGFEKLFNENQSNCLTKQHSLVLSSEHDAVKRLLADGQTQLNSVLEEFKKNKDQFVRETEIDVAMYNLFLKLETIQNSVSGEIKSAYAQMKNTIENFSSVKGHVDSISQLINELENQISFNLEELKFIAESSLFVSIDIGENTRDKKMLLDYRARLEGLKDLQKSDERLSGLISELKTEIQKRKEGFIDFGQYHFSEFKNKILGKINTFLTLIDASILKMSKGSFYDADYLNLKKSLLELGFSEDLIPMVFSAASLFSIKTSINLTLFDFSRPSIQTVSDFMAWVTAFNGKEKAILNDVENKLKILVDSEKLTYVGSLEDLMKKMDANPSWSVSDLNQVVLNSNLRDFLTIKEGKISDFFYVFSQEENRIFKRMLNRLIELAKTPISILDYEEAIKSEGVEFSNNHLSRIKQCSEKIVKLQPIKQKNLVQGVSVEVEVNNSSGKELLAKKPEEKLIELINQILSFLEKQEWKSQVHEFMGLFGGARFKANGLEYKVPNSVAKIHHDLHSVKNKPFDEQVKMLLKIGEFAVSEKNRSPRIWRSKGLFAGYEDIRSAKTTTMLNTLSGLNQDFIATAIKGEEGKQGDNISKLHEFLSEIAKQEAALQTVNSSHSAGDATSSANMSKQKP